MVKVEGHRIIRAPVQKVFQLISRLETAPRVTGLWLTADLVERKGTTVTVQYRGYFAGLPVESLQRATLHPPHRIDFRQTRGGLKAFRGQYLLRPVEGDTEVSLTIEAEAGVAFISEQSARLVLHAFIERSLEKFKLTAERDLPRVARKAAEDGAKEQAPAEGTPVGPEAQAPVPPISHAPETEAAVPSVAASPQPAGQPGGRRRRRRRGRRRGGGKRPSPEGQQGSGGASGPGPGRGGSG